ncbi:mannosyltransferase, partial [Coemansia sp. RSA 487]
TEMNAQGNSTSIKQARLEKRNLKRARKAQEAAQADEQKQAAARQLDRREATTQVYVPSLSLLFRILSLVRIAGALTAPIQDCDEVYNYWEPLHLLQFGTGKQTWEYAPQYALRSYGFLYFYKWIITALHVALGFRSKTQVFYALRIALAMVSAGCEALFVRRIAECVDRKIANLTALALFGLAGLFHSGSAVLPTSFSMYLCALGSAAAMKAPSCASGREHLVYRVVPAVTAFVMAAAGGWPYAIVVAVPFALEEVLICGPSDAGGVWWRARRICWFAAIGFGSLGIVLGAMITVDSWHYGRLVVAAWNQVAYNVFGGVEGGNSQLYGTEPWYFYIKNGVVNGNMVMLLAMASLPGWIAYYAVLRVTANRKEQQGKTADRLFSAHWLLLFRILPFFVALFVFSLQPHKEERFLSIVYPHMCFNAAATLSLMHPLCAWMLLRVANAKVREKLVKGATFVDRLSIGVLAMSAALGVSRMAALNTYYAAPTRAFLLLQENRPIADGILPLGPTIKSIWDFRAKKAATDKAAQLPPTPEEGEVAVVCMGKDWYRFPSSYWLPGNHRLEYVPTKYFDGQLPGDFVSVQKSGESLRASTSAHRADFNALNQWEPSHALSDNTTGTIDRMCNYVVDIDYPGRSESSILSDDVSRRETKWEVAGCERILDAESTWLLGRVLYVPRQLLSMLGGRQHWGRMCVYRKKS